ncbi:MAG: VWA domain-containing protein [Vicinamibacteria bacterium]|nr:VWA domain-containing protein [Vicinamibacteria bacterium]
MVHAALLLALAQDPRPELVFPAGVELVQVVVSVTAKDGAPVGDLLARDFVIRENGKARAIETFLRTRDAADSERAPVELVLLLDTSTSMAADLRRAGDVIVDFARAMPSFARGRVFAFDRDGYDRAFDAETVGPVIDQMIRLKGGAGTRIFDAVIDGAGLVSQRRGRRVMVLFTDGDDSTSRRGLQDAVRALQESEVTCYGVSYASRLAAFGSGSGTYKDLAREAQRSIETLARGSGGFVVDGTSPDVVAQLKRIADDISSLYVIGFAPGPSKKAEHRRLSVEVVRRDLTVRHREGYDARPR